MKLAIISDIHGNVAALDATTAHLEAWQPDLVIVNGDVVNRGPNSLDCWRFVRHKQASAGWLVTKGNHEDFVLEYVADHPPDPRRFELNRHGQWTYHQLGQEVAALATLPDDLTLTAPDGSEVRLRHASMRSNRDGILQETPAEEVRQQIAPAPPLYCTAHIHWPMIRQIDQTLIVRSGSVGSPRDGDVRASYAQLCWPNGRWANSGWQVHIPRISYDRADTERDYQELGYLAEGGPVAALIYHEWRTAQPVLAPWQRQYQEAVLAGEIGLATAVAQFLRAHGFTY